jgi:flagellar biosynthesis protein FlhB
VAETDQEKTQEPTEKRLEDARKRGDVPVAQDVRHAVMFAAILLLLGTLGAAAAKSLSKMRALNQPSLD